MVNFWEEKPLSELSRQEWESLCDGCARCCLHKLQDEDSGQVQYTSVVCKYLDEPKCQCSCYEKRHELVPDCVWLTPETAGEYKWLPATCAYRLIAEGKDLQWWHPLVSGRAETVQEAGISIRHKCVSEAYVHPDGFQERIIRWVEQ